MHSDSPSDEHKVMRCAQCQPAELQQLLSRYQLSLHWLEREQDIPGSFWGAPEAGLIKHHVYIRPDTPVHSLLHECGHVICMDAQRRQRLHTDANGRTAAEENAVCYLQIILADQINGFGRQRALLDMDRWGYSFRLGSAHRWFEEDAADAQQWLLAHDLIAPNNQPTYRLRRE